MVIEGERWANPCGGIDWVLVSVDGESSVGSFFFFLVLFFRSWGPAVWDLIPHRIGSRKKTYQLTREWGKRNRKTGN